MVMCCKLKCSGIAKLTIKQISESFQTCTEQQSDLYLSGSVALATVS